MNIRKRLKSRTKFLTMEVRFKLQIRRVTRMMNKSKFRILGLGRHPWAIYNEEEQ